MKRAKLAAAFLLVLLVSCSSAYGDATLLLGEPYGSNARFNPTGHAAVYLTRLCAASPTVLRRCQPGETGIVISRYHRIAGFDWIAVPLIPYLYAVDHADQVPAFASPKNVTALRNEYRRVHLQDLLPDSRNEQVWDGDWIQLVGATYDRRIVAFTVKSTETQDDDLIRELNSRKNRTRYNLLFRNCADFARDIINWYYPKAMRSGFISDLGLTTPKHIAKSLVRYSTRNAEIQLSTFVIPQIPGSRSDSHGARGVLESLVKTKKYLIPLSVVQPWIPTGLAAGYLVTGRFNPDHHAVTVYNPADLERRALSAAVE